MHKHKNTEQFARLNHNYNTRHRLQLITHAHSTTIYQKSLSFNGIKLWNTIPNAIQNKRSQNSFKSSYKKYLLTVAQEAGGPRGQWPPHFLRWGAKVSFGPPTFRLIEGRDPFNFKTGSETLYLLDLVQYSQPVLELPRLFPFSIQSGNRRGRVNM